MLKIIETAPRNRAVILILEGHVGGPWVEELRRLCDRALAAGNDLMLDLAGVAFVDRDGVDLLQNLKTRHVPLVNCSAFVTAQLKG